MKANGRAILTDPRGLSRRDALSALGALGGGAWLATSFARAEARAEEPRPSVPRAAPAYRGKHAVKPLPFDPAKLAGISERLITSHHDNNYAGAVRRLNAIQQQLGSLPKDAAPYQVGSLKREELLAMNSMILHELYFGNLGGSGRADGSAAKQLATEYGTLEAWEHDLRQTALSLAGGSGWVIVAVDPGSGTLHNWWAWDHTNGLAGGTPVLVLDLYEHAYQMDYGAKTSSYIDAFLHNLNWDEVNRRIELARGRSAPAPTAV